MQLYISPRQKMAAERWLTSANLGATVPLKDRILGHLNIGASVAPVLSHHLEYTASNAPHSLHMLTMSQYDVLAAGTSAFDAAVAVTIPVGRIALRPQLRYAHGHYNGIRADSDAVEAAVTIAF